jgi:hypothetical protein
LGKKLLVAILMEGKMSGEQGLDGFEDDDDMVTSMVRELLEEGKVGESADAVWANLAHERVQMFAQAPILVADEQEDFAIDSNVPLDESSAFAFDTAEEEEVSEVEEAEPLPEAAKPFLVPAPVPVVVPEPPPPSQTNVLAFNAMRPKVSRRKPVVEDEEQMLLFG